MPVTNATLWRVITEPKLNEDGSRVSCLLVTPESAKKDANGTTVTGPDGKAVYPESMMVDLVVFKPKKEGASTLTFDNAKTLSKGSMVAITGDLEDGSYYVNPADSKVVDVSAIPHDKVREQVAAGTLRKEVRNRMRPMIIWGTVSRGSASSTAAAPPPTVDSLPDFLREGA